MGTIDALLAQLCLHHELVLLTSDEDFDHLAKYSALSVWKAYTRPERRHWSAVAA